MGQGRPDALDRPAILSYTAAASSPLAIDQSPTALMIWTRLDQYRNLGLLFLRVATGLYMAIGHGWSKVVGGPSQWAELGGAMGLLGINFLPTVWGFLSMAAEFGCALLVVAGIATRPAALILALNMAVAANMHIQTGNGSPELALMYGIVFLSLAVIGPGKYSFDDQLT